MMNAYALSWDGYSSTRKKTGSKSATELFAFSFTSVRQALTSDYAHTSIAAHTHVS
jgi:hypothetical protein